MAEPEKPPLTYRDAGVDIEAGERLVGAIGPLAAATKRPGVMGGLGGFGALFDLKAAGFSDPVLVSGTDGVGTKLLLAIETGRHETIGVDLVAMCVNDVLAQGAEPLFFLDYFATSALDETVAEAVVSGVAQGCRQAGCALVGGETAEMPDMYSPGHYDLAGFVVGAAERKSLLPNHAAMRPGDVLIALPSSGPHSNGYSLIRKVIARAGLSLDAPAPFSNATLADELLTPTRIYARLLAPLIRAGDVAGLAHITGGGLVENAPRMCPDGLAPRIDRAAWTPPPVFDWIAREGGVETDEMHRAFNMGVGMVLAVAAERADAVLAWLTGADEAAFVIGELAAA